LYYIFENMTVLNSIHIVPKKFETMVSLPIFGFVRSFGDWIVTFINKPRE